MQVSSGSPLNVIVRLVLSFALGALAGSYAGEAAPVVDGLVAVGILLGPPLLSLALDSRPVKKGPAILRYVGLLLAILVIVGGVAGVVAVGDESATVASVASGYQILAVVLIPFVAAFTFGGIGVASARSLALGCAACAWVGMGARNFIQVSATGLFSSSNGNDLAPLAFVVIGFVYVLGFAITPIEGLFGAWLHARLSPQSGRLT